MVKGVKLTHTYNTMKCVPLIEFATQVKYMAFSVLPSWNLLSHDLKKGKQIQKYNPNYGNAKANH